MKILIPGGHLTPALALIDWIRLNHQQDELIFVGRIYSQESLKQPAIEAYEVEKRQIKFIPFQAVRFYQTNLLSWLSWPCRFLTSLIQAGKILAREKPDVVMSFGSYVAVPIVIMARIKHVPVLAHEGTRVIGLANKIIFKFAHSVALAFDQPQNFELKNINKKITVTGNPLRLALKTTEKTTKPVWFKSEVNKNQILLILGGNQGSEALNELVKNNLTWLTQEFIVVHQCGRANKLHNYAQELPIFAQKNKIDTSRYYVLPWIDETDLVWLYQHAQLAVSRAGANSIQELIFHQLPAILIPLPHANFNEQYVNAQHLVSEQAGYLLAQENLSVNSFKQAIAQMVNNRSLYQKNLQTVKNKLPLDPAQQLYNLLTDLVNSHRP